MRIMLLPPAPNVKIHASGSKKIQLPLPPKSENQKNDNDKPILAVSHGEKCKKLRAHATPMRYAASCARTKIPITLSYRRATPKGTRYAPDTTEVLQRLFHFGSFSSTSFRLRYLFLKYKLIKEPSFLRIASPPNVSIRCAKTSKYSRFKPVLHTYQPDSKGCALPSSKRVSIICRFRITKLLSFPIFPENPRTVILENPAYLPNPTETTRSHTISSPLKYGAT